MAPGLSACAQGLPSVEWTVVTSTVGLAADRYRGELTDLPLRDAAPGDWCRIVVRDERGEMRWTLLAIETAKARSIFAEGRHRRRSLSGPPGARVGGTPMRVPVGSSGPLRAASRM
jgi:hypothetical protein